MPRKRWRARLSYYDNPVINPEDRNAVEDHDLVRHALVDFDELAVLPNETREQLVADLVDAIWFWRAGVKAGKRGMSDKDLAQQIFLSRMSGVPWNEPVYPQHGGGSDEGDNGRRTRELFLPIGPRACRRLRHTPP